VERSPRRGPGRACPCLSVLYSVRVIGSGARRAAELRSAVVRLLLWCAAGTCLAKANQKGASKSSSAPCFPMRQPNPHFDPAFRDTGGRQPPTAGCCKCDPGIPTTNSSTKIILLPGTVSLCARDKISYPRREWFSGRSEGTIRDATLGRRQRCTARTGSIAKEYHPLHLDRRGYNDIVAVPGHPHRHRATPPGNRVATYGTIWETMTRPGTGDNRMRNVLW
jgi:hypothetical protein